MQGVSAKTSEGSGRESGAGRNLWPRLMSTQAACRGSMGYASAATTVTLCPAKHTDRNASEPALIMRTRYVLPGATVML